MRTSILFTVFAAIGSLFLILSLYFAFRSFQKLQSWRETSGVLESIGRGNTIFSFDYQRKEIKVQSTYTSDTMTKGEIKVIYPDGKPELAEIKTFGAQWFMPLFFSAFALIFGGIGYGGRYFFRPSVDLKNELVTLGKGRQLSLPITRIERDSTYSVNGLNPWVIVAEFHEKTNNVLYQFRSEHIWVDPTPFAEGKEVTIYVDPKDFKKYYVDVSFLPKVVGGVDNSLTDFFK